MKLWQFIALFWLGLAHLPQSEALHQQHWAAVAIVAAALFDEWRASRAGGKT